MPICPGCKREVDHLDVYEPNATVRWELTIEKETNELNWEQKESVSASSPIQHDYTCPECGGRIVNTMEEARLFLQGGEQS